MLLASALVLVCRCALDPGSMAYYHFPLLLILLAYDAVAGRRVPIAGLLGVAVSFVVLDRFPAYLGMGLANDLYIAATVTACAVIAARLCKARPTAPIRPPKGNVGSAREVSGAAATISGMRLLVVDDDRALRDVLRRALMLAGYDVRLADTGAGALSEVAATVPDAVVLDIGLPDIDGLEVCRLLRREGNRVPVLMLTARDAVSDRIDGLDAGADDYLVKPFDIDELKARLRALLRRAGGDASPDGGLSFAELRLDPARHGVSVGEKLRRADPHRVPAARAADAEPAPGASSQPDLRPRVGL